MTHHYLVEILTVALFIALYFDWNKIKVKSKLRAKRFIRNHIVARIDPDFDLDFPPGAKDQPTGDKKATAYIPVESKYILGCDPVSLNNEQSKVSILIYNTEDGTHLRYPNAE